MPDNTEASRKPEFDNSRSSCDSLANAAGVPNTSAEDKGNSPNFSHENWNVQPYRIHWMWKETMERLHCLDLRAREGKCIDEASEFARWVQFSGLIHFFKENPQDEPLKVSAAELQRLITDTLFDCEQAWKKTPRGPWVSLSELEAVNHKLDLIAAKLATLSAPVDGRTEVAGDASEPTLRVIPGAA